MTSLGAWLEQDHERLDELWDQAARSRSTDPERASALYHQFAEGLLRHIDAEETLLFPFCESHDLVPDPSLTQVLRDEHEEIRTSLTALLRMIDDPKSGLEGVTQVLRNVLWAHNTREEGLLYPWLGTNTTEGEGLVLADRIRELITRGESPI